MRDSYNAPYGKLLDCEHTAFRIQNYAEIAFVREVKTEIELSAKNLEQMYNSQYLNYVFFRLLFILALD